MESIMTSSPKRNDKCAICLDWMKNPIKLPCNHKFCYACLDTWRPKFDIHNNRTCPQCRCAIPPTREMVAEIKSIKTAFVNIEAQLCTSGPLVIPEHPNYAYIKLLPKNEQQPEMRRALERQCQVQLDNVNQFEARYGETPKALDDTACFDKLPEHMVEAVRVNDFEAILDFLGPVPISKRRLNAKCRAYSDDTLLHMASTYDNILLMKFLLSIGADMNAPNLHQFTPLFHALVDGESETAARMLLRWGARKVVQCSDLFEPSPALAYLAKTNGKPAIAELLKSKLGGRRCMLHRMFYLPHFNGQVGIVGKYDWEFKVYHVKMEKTGETIRVSHHLLKRCDQTPRSFPVKKIDHLTLGEVARLQSFNELYRAHKVGGD